MLVDVWHEQKHAWPLQETWLTRKRREKREKMDSKVNFFSFPSLLPLSLLFLSSHYSSLLMTLEEAINTQTLEYFCQGKLLAVVNFTFSFFETLIQKLVTHCHYYRKRGSASYIVGEWLLWVVVERERERPVTSLISLWNREWSCIWLPRRRVDPTRRRVLSLSSARTSKCM